MSEENIAVVREAYGVWQSRGLDAFLEQLDPNFEFEEDPHFPEAGTYRGRDAFASYARQFLAAWETFEFELKEVREAMDPDRVLTRFVIRGRGHGSGVETEIEAGWVWTIREGRLARCRAHLEMADALGDAGLSEQAE
jgi:ketosteroid isomerase-like protein